MREKKGKLPAQHSGVISALFSLFLILFRIVVDYSNLPDKYKHLLVSDEIRREGDLLERRVNELSILKPLICGYVVFSYIFP